MWLTPLSATVNPKIPAKTKNTRVFFGFFRYFFGYTRVFRNFYQLRLVSAPAQQLLTTVVNTCFVFQHLPFNAILCFNVKTQTLLLIVHVLNMNNMNNKAASAASGDFYYHI